MMPSAGLELPLTFRADTHQYFVGSRELPSVTKILNTLGLAQFDRPWFTAEVRQRGSYVHAAIALDNEEALDEETLDPVLLPYVAGWRRYLAESGAIVEHYEQPVHDLAAGYAGTLDAIVCEGDAAAGTPGGKHYRWRTVIDIKPAWYPSVGPQVAAYTRAARALYPAPTLFRRAAIILPGDGTYKREPLTDQTDEATFMAAVHLYHWRSTHGCL